MKYFINILGLIIILLSCSNDDKELDFQYQLTASIDISEMAKGVKDGNFSDIITEKGEVLVTVTYLIYNDRGKLINKSEKKNSPFFSEITFSSTLYKGNFTIIALAWTCHSLDVDMSIYDILNDDQLQSLKVKTCVFPNGVNILGTSKLNIFVDQSKIIDMVVQPTGSFMSLNFIYSSQTDAKSIKVIFTERNDEYLVNSETSNLATEVWESVITLSSDLDMNGIPFFFFPVKQLETIWLALDDSGEILYYNSDIILDFEKGENRVIRVYLDEMTIDITPTT